MRHCFETARASRCGAGLLLGFIFCVLVGCTTPRIDEAARTACAKITQVEAMPRVVAPLDAADPHSTAGVLWADLEAACPDGKPAANVSTDWIGLVESELVAVLPMVAPQLAGML